MLGRLGQVRLGWVAVWQIQISGIRIIYLDPDAYKKFPESGSVSNPDPTKTIENRK